MGLLRPPKEGFHYPETSKKLGSKYGKMKKEIEDYKAKKLGARGPAVPIPGQKKSDHEKDKADAVKNKFKLTKVDGKSVSPQRLKAKKVLREMGAKREGSKKRRTSRSFSEIRADKDNY
tara:strand:- start:125 stop:481 length:357 start_codon:yes stop_codon:yes gene_type:complete